MFFILEGEGKIRMGPETWPIGKGDLIACPPGGKGTAHQIINTGAAELKFLAVSTKLSPELAPLSRYGQVRRRETEVSLAWPKWPRKTASPACSPLSGAKAKARWITGKGSRATPPIPAIPAKLR